MLRPSIDLAEIELRLDAVESGVRDLIARAELRRAIDGILDIERLLSSVTLETANPRDTLALAASLAKIPAAKAALARLASQRLNQLQQLLDPLEGLPPRIEQTIVDEPPLTFNDGGVIRTGIDSALDELRDL